VAVRNAELLLARERAIFKDQQREVVHEAADAVAEMDRAYTVLQTSFNRLNAARDQVASVQAAYEEGEGKVPLDLLLDAQRRLTETETEYVLNRARYSLALKNVHFVKGTLLEYDGVYLAEGPWPGKAYADAAKLEAGRSVPVPLNYASSCAPVVSRGAFPQHALEPMPTVEAAGDPFQDEPLPLTPPAMQPGDVPAPVPLEVPMPMGQSKATSSGVVTASASNAASDEVIPAIHFAAPAQTEQQRAEAVAARRLPPTAR
jgi:hypothetical protein